MSGAREISTGARRRLPRRHLARISLTSRSHLDASRSHLARISLAPRGSRWPASLPAKRSAGASPGRRYTRARRCCRRRGGGSSRPPGSLRVPAGGRRVKTERRRPVLREGGGHTERGEHGDACVLQLHLAVKLDLALGRVGREACGSAAAVSTEAQGGARDAKRRHNTERVEEAERTRDAGQVLDVEGRRRGRRLGHLRRGGGRRHHSHGRPMCLMTQVTGAGVTGGSCMRTSARGARVVVDSRARTIWREEGRQATERRPPRRGSVWKCRGKGVRRKEFARSQVFCFVSFFLPGTVNIPAWWRRAVLPSSHPPLACLPVFFLSTPGSRHKTGAHWH